MSKEEFPSFDKLLNSNWDYVYSYLLKKTSNKYISEEITIQSFSKAFEKIKTYNPKYNFKTWLISIAKNTYSDYLKKKKLLYKEVNSKKIENIDDLANYITDDFNMQTFQQGNTKLIEELGNQTLTNTIKNINNHILNEI